MRVLLFRILVLLVAVPVIELALLIEVGQWIGTLPVILLILGTGLIGAILARSQGLGALYRIREELRSGHPPGHSIIDGVLVLIGAIILATPGIISDVLGLLLLIPASRSFVKMWLGRKLRQWVKDGSIRLFIR